MLPLPCCSCYREEGLGSVPVHVCPAEPVDVRASLFVVGHGCFCRSLVLELEIRVGELNVGGWLFGGVESWWWRVLV